MSANEQLQAAFDEFHRASVVLKMRLANAPHAEQTEIQRAKVDRLRAQLFDGAYREVGLDPTPVKPKRASRSESRSNQVRAHASPLHGAQATHSSSIDRNSSLARGCKRLHAPWFRLDREI
jgi:hypothetical protein